MYYVLCASMNSADMELETIGDSLLDFTLSHNIATMMIVNN